MSEWVSKPIGALLMTHFPGEWGVAPSSHGELVRVFRGADFVVSGRLERNGGAPRRVSPAKLNKLELKPGDILLEKSGGSPDQPVGRVSYFDGADSRAVASNFLQTLRPAADVNSKLLFYLLQHQYARGRVLPFQQQTTGIINFRLKDYLKEWVAVPANREEQRRLADIMSAVDEQVLVLNATIEKKKVLRAGVMRRLVLGPHRPTGWKFHGLAKDWEVSRFGAEFSLQLGKMLSSVAKTGTGEVPYLGNRNVQWRRFELESLETMYFNPRERLKYELRKGDLLICEGGEVGRAAVWQGAPFECFYQKAIHRARSSSGRVLPEFALAVLELASELGWFADYVVQTSIAHLPREKLIEFPIPVPKPYEQRAICSTIDAINQDIETDCQAMSKLTKMSHGLRDALLQPRKC